jgi:hypothetical protein
VNEIVLGCDPLTGFCEYDDELSDLAIKGEVLLPE